VQRIAIIVILMTPVITWLFGAPLWIIVCHIVVLSAEPNQGSALADPHPSGGFAVLFRRAN
jgi:hypothetical protein